MNKKLQEELIRETDLKDIAETYKPVVQIIGVEKFVELADYAKGDELYFPKPESILAPARNRRIEQEYNGYNMKELAEKYDITIKQIAYILRNVPHPGQIDIFDWMQEQEGGSENISPKDI